ncbi:CaiB/BaiF CoA transferase family protein [Paenibacillus cymbidii]|uniref:CaiB/BaiF CoA transferase family protein n=1 Tax=Paenibacillus cymbidii TaxID=1639034 RepID=UPI00108014E8|nr:CoA transferase [Paenibacillus cymbidii]
MTTPASANLAKPLEGLTVVDFCQFLSGPYAALRLSDLGARVIKIENAQGGDLCRRLYISNLELDGDSTLFHSINRNKESVAVNLKQPEDRAFVEELLQGADIMMQNFRPGVIERLGFSFEKVTAINPRIIYGSISGYGQEGPLVGMPGQDLLVQSISGIAWQNERAGEAPVPFGLAVADMMAGAHLVQGLLAAAVRRAITGKGAKVEVSLLESTLDTMQEVWSDELQQPGAREGSRPPVEQPPLGGIYAAREGWLALGAVPAADVAALGRLVGSAALAAGGEPAASRAELQRALRADTAAQWAARLEAAGFACAEVLDWLQLLQTEAFRRLEMVQTVRRANGVELATLRCPIRIDGRQFRSPVGSPQIGEHNERIARELAERKMTRAGASGGANEKGA